MVCNNVFIETFTYAYTTLRLYLVLIFFILPVVMTSDKGMNSITKLSVYYVLITSRFEGCAQIACIVPSFSFHRNGNQAESNILLLKSFQEVWQIHVLWRKSRCQTPKSRTVFDSTAAEGGHSEAPEDQAEGV